MYLSRSIRAAACGVLLLAVALCGAASPALCQDAQPDANRAATVKPMPRIVSRADRRMAEALRRQAFHLQRMGNYTKAIAVYRKSLQYDPSPGIAEHVARLEAMAREAGQPLPGEPMPDPNAYVPKPKRQTPYETFPGAHMHPSVPPMSATLGYPEDQGNPSAKGIGAPPAANATLAGASRLTGADAMARLYKLEGLELLRQHRYMEAKQSLEASLEYVYDPLVESKLSLVAAKIREMNALATVRQRVREEAAARRNPVPLALDNPDAAALGEDAPPTAGEVAAAMQRLASTADYADLDGRAQSVEVVDCTLLVRSGNTGMANAVVELFPLPQVDRIEYWPGSPFGVDLYAAENVVRRVYLQNGAYVSDMVTDTAGLTASADVTGVLRLLVASCGGHPTVSAAR